MIRVPEYSWKLPDPHTTLGGVSDLTTAAKKKILKLIDNSNNAINNRLHDEDINKFVKSHIKEQAIKR